MSFQNLVKKLWLIVYGLWYFLKPIYDAVKLYQLPRHKTYNQFFPRYIWTII
jgi:hypothetical protein